MLGLSQIYMRICRSIDADPRLMCMEGSCDTTGSQISVLGYLTRQIHEQGDSQNPLPSFQVALQHPLQETSLLHSQLIS